MTDKRLRKQARGTARNTRELVGDFTFDQILPPSIAGFIQTLFALIPRSLGRGTAKQQVYASVTLILIAIISAPISLGYSLVVSIPFMIGLIVGLYRLNPWVNSTFKRLRGRKLRDRDVPLWKRD